MVDFSNKEYFVLEEAIKYYNELNGTKYNLDLMLFDDDKETELKLRLIADTYSQYISEVLVTATGPDKVKYEFIYNALIDIKVVLS